MRVPHSTLLVSAALLARHSGIVAQPLPALSLIGNSTTVSGISAGAFFAVQFQFAHSSLVRGAGVVAGGPYHCSGTGGFAQYVLCCTLADATVNVSALAAYAATAAAAGLIDPLAYLQDQTVHLFSGTIDSFVSHATMLALARLYALLGVQTSSIFNLTAEHAWVTSVYGASCSTLAAPFVNNCGVDFAGDFLAATAKAAGLPWNATPGVYTPANLLNFSQADFGAGAANVSMDPLGFIYVPRTCAAGARCRLHVNFHGCDQARSELGDLYVRQTQLNEWAESNGVVILYPQATYNLADGNILACWDTWGYDGTQDYATQKGAQIAIVKSIVDQLLAGAGHT